MLRWRLRLTSHLVRHLGLYISHCMNMSNIARIFAKTSSCIVLWTFARTMRTLLFLGRWVRGLVSYRSTKQVHLKGSTDNRELLPGLRG
jgi:hypothetical protein